MSSRLSDEQYTCQGCGQTKKCRARTDGTKPTHCLQCRHAEIRVPDIVLADGTCNQIGDVDLFYPDKGGSNKKAKAICAACPVVHACLKYAMDAHEAFGIWGGLSERERRKLTKSTAA